MSDDKKDESKQEDPNKNLKSEMDRKFANVMEQLKSTTEALTAQIAGIAPKKEAAAPQSSKSFKDKFYTDEDAAIAEFKEDTKKEILSEISMNNRQHQVLDSLYRDFPELADATHDLTRKAAEIHKALPDWEKRSPSSYRLAALEAAQALDILPSAKRKAAGDDEGFTLSGGGSKNTRERKPKAGELADNTLEFAKRMGLNTSDEKVVERLKKHAARESWTKYKPIND